MTTTDICALIVEDDPSWQQILGEILTDAGLTVDIADNLEAAVDKLRAVPHRLAIVDLSLSRGGYHDQDGLCVLDAVRRLDPGCVTVMLTGFATVELAVSVLAKHGAFSCLRKETFNRAKFRDLVNQALASAPPVTTGSDDSLTGTSRDKAPKTTQAADGDAPLALVVEDDAGWRCILSELLTDGGYQVCLCTSFGEALGCLRREKYALAVVDLSLTRSTVRTTGLRARRLPEQDLDGYRLLTSTRDSEIPTVVVSGVATPAHIERAYAEQAIFAFVQKQAFDRGAFLRIVEEARSAATSSSELDCLTKREREVLELLVQGMTNGEMADALFITINTVKRHLKSIFRKLDVHARSAAAARAISGGLAIG
jgi:DNA-binding NarL/FixJ family response regulator